MSMLSRYPVGLALLTIVSCSDDGSSSVDVMSDTVDHVTDTAPDVDAATDTNVGPTCDETRRPIVMVHGFLASGDTWSPHARRFAANGWCTGYVRAFDWNTLDRGGDHTTLLDEFVDSVLEDTGSDRVDLVGHSAGGGLGYEYLEDAERAAKVAHYIHVASGVESGPAGPDADVPTLNLWSAADLAIEGPGEIEGAENVEIVGADHYAAATNESSFDAIFRFVTEGDVPQTLSIPPTDVVDLCGRVVSLGENVVPVGARVRAWPLDPSDASRATDEPVLDIAIEEDGHWGPVRAEPGVPYEFEVAGPDADDISVSYFRRGFEASDPLVYLRTLPAPGSIAGALLALIPFEHEAPMLAVFSASSGMIAGVHSLTVDGIEVLTDETAAAEDTTIALFLFDDDEDLESDLTVPPLLATFPFLSGLDVSLPAGPVLLRLDDRELTVRAIPATEGATIAVFE